MNHYLNFGWSLVALCTAVPAPLAAQVAESTAADEAAAVDEIVVTARKRSETLQNIPLAITAFSAQKLEDIGARNLEDISVRTPGLSYSSQGGSAPGRLDTAIRFRGMNINTTLPTQQLATVFIDGIPVIGGIGGVGLEDLERVEVIKGPQSAFFGRSTFGGAINYVTQTPGDDYKGSVTATAGSHGEHELRLTHEGAIVPGKLAYRITGRTFHRNGAYRSVADQGRVGEENTDAIQLTLYATPTDNFDAKLRAMAYQDEDGPAIGGFIGAGYRNCFAKNGGPLFVRPPGFSGPGPVDFFCGALPIAGMGEIGTNTVLNPRGQAIWLDRTALTLPPLLEDAISLDHVGIKRRVLRGSLAMNYALPSDITLTSLSGYERERLMHVGDFDQTPADFWWQAHAREFKAFSQEFRISSADDQRLSWLGGVNLFKQQYDENALAWYVPTDFIGGDNRVSNEVTTTAIFGALNYELTNQVKVSLEGRYQQDKIDEGTSAGGIALKKTFKNFVPRVIVQYQPSSNTNFFATYSQGNKPGDFNDRVIDLNDDERAQVVAQTGGGNFVPEEELENFELGWKQQLFDNRISFAFSAYYMKWKNQQTRVPAVVFNPLHPSANPVTGTRNIEVLIAAGKTDLWGIEFEGNANLTTGLNAGVTFGWAASEYKDFTCGFVARFTGSTDCAGNSSPRFPEFSGSANLSYMTALTTDWAGFVRAEAIYVGKSFVDESNLAWLDDSTTVNLRLGAESDALRLEFWARNLFDKYYYVSGIRQSDFTNGFNFNQQGVVATPSNGREVGMTATLKF